MTKAMECTERHKTGIYWRQAAQDRDGWGDQLEMCLAFLDNSDRRRKRRGGGRRR